MSDAPKFKTFRDLRSVPKLGGGVKNAGGGRNGAAFSPAAPKNNSADGSPVRDFQKIPNSVARNLDLFRGKSKQVWDYLWSISRGSINPARTVRRSRKEIKDGSKLGSLVTVDAAIDHLTNIGLLKVSKNIGSGGGNEYEIFAPEELDLSSTTSTSISSISSTTSSIQNLDILDILGSSRASITQVVENKDISGRPKTSSKTNTDDDDSALAILTEKFEAASRKLVGKNLSKNDREKWGELGELLVMEMELAAARTKSVSNLPAFLTEHLRRRLTGRESSAEAKAGKSERFGKAGVVEIESVETYEAEPLNETARKTVLATFREYLAKGQNAFIQSFQASYTEDDWTWLMTELKNQTPSV